VHILSHTTVDSLRKYLQEHPINIIHFMGFSQFNRDTGESALTFERGDGTADSVSSKLLAEMFKSHRSLKLVFLNACDTGRVIGKSPLNPFRGVAEELMLCGIPAVVGMQFAISDRAAITFSSAFYRRMAAGDSIETATTEGRQALAIMDSPTPNQWVTPVVFISTGETHATEQPNKKQPEESRLQVFLCHASEDKPEIRNLYQHLQLDDFEVWLDEVNIIPGTRWRDEIARALRQADVILICLSRQSVTKTGFLQKELTIALDLLDQHPEDEIFIIPVRLDDCKVPSRLEDIQRVDLFTPTGYGKLTTALKTKAKQKR
jgi:hypothetical protein